MELLVSVVMPVYNVESYIGRAIESVLEQSYRNIELIIVDDGSKDSTESIVKKYNDSRIKYLKNSENQGPAKSRNRALDIAKGEYITFLDGDDFWDQDKVLNQVRFMEEHGLEMSHGNYRFCDTEGKIVKSVETDKEIDYERLLRGNQFKIMTVMLKAEVVKNRRFEEIKHEDYAFFLDILKGVGKSVNYGGNDSYCTIGRKESLSCGKLKSAIWTWNIYRKHEGLGFFKSLFYFINYVYQGVCKYR